MLLPQELRNYSFSHAIRGYTAAEVEEYIDFLIGKYEELYRENGELERKLSIAMQSLDTLRAREEKIAALELEVKKAAARILADSEKKQQEILADAEIRRRQIIEDAGAYADRITAEADAHVTLQEKRFDTLKKEVESLRDTLFTAYSGHIDRVEELVNTVLSEKFADPVQPAADLAEIAEEVAVQMPSEPAEPAGAQDPTVLMEPEESAESPEDVYTEEELREDDPSPAEEIPQGNTAIFLPDDFPYDEDVYSEEELRDADGFAQPIPFEEPAAFEKAEIFEDVESFAEIPKAADAEAFAETAEDEVFTAFFPEEDLPAEKADNASLAEEDARLLQELHEAFDKNFSARRTDTAPETAAADTETEPVYAEEQAGNDEEDDEWLAALKKLENVISDPSKYAPKSDPNDFTFLEEEEVAVDTGRRGLFGKKKPKDR